VRHTPSASLSRLKLSIAAELLIDLKLECLQVIGSFKARGAMTALFGAGKSSLHAGY